jgi:hypothetical protein
MELKPLLKLLPIILPFAVRWVEREERKIIMNGVSLSPEGQMDASWMGVAHPEKIRLMRVDRIPILNGIFMKFLSRMFPHISANTVGLSLCDGIYIRSKYWGDRLLIAHECVHTGQYERSGDISGFLRSYFTECIELGYPDAPMEQEAILRSAGLLDDGQGGSTWHF